MDDTPNMKLLHLSPFFWISVQAGVGMSGNSSRIAIKLSSVSRFIAETKLKLN